MQPSPSAETWGPSFPILGYSMLPPVVDFLFRFFELNEGCGRELKKKRERLPRPPTGDSPPVVEIIHFAGLAAAGSLIRFVNAFSSDQTQGSTSISTRGLSLKVT